MRFNSTSAPKSGQTIDWPREAKDASGIVPPRLDPDIDIIFRREYEHWDTQLGEEYPHGGQLIIALAKLMRSRIGAALPDVFTALRSVHGPLDTTRYGLEALLKSDLALQPTHMAVGPGYAELDVAGHAFMQSVSALAFSRMLREAKFEDSSRKRYPKNAVVFDSHPNYLPWNGMHLKREPLLEVIGIEPPRSEEGVWLEGESVYLWARSPAQPSLLQSENYEDILLMKGMRVDEYTSIVPRLKPNALDPWWQTSSKTL